jgi:hypothetical protein
LLWQLFPGCAVVGDVKEKKITVMVVKRNKERLNFILFSVDYLLFVKKFVSNFKWCGAKRINIYQYERLGA